MRQSPKVILRHILIQKYVLNVVLVSGIAHQVRSFMRKTQLDIASRDSGKTFTNIKIINKMLIQVVIFSVRTSY
jgi:hypothetical protein